jgi:hypothetical protein
MYRYRYRYRTRQQVRLDLAPVAVPALLLRRAVVPVLVAREEIVQLRACVSRVTRVARVACWRSMMDGWMDGWRDGWMDAGRASVSGREPVRTDERLLSTESQSQSHSQSLSQLQPQPQPQRAPQHAWIHIRAPGVFVCIVHAFCSPPPLSRRTGPWHHGCRRRSRRRRRRRRLGECSARCATRAFAAASVSEASRHTHATTTTTRSSMNARV